MKLPDIPTPHVVVLENDRGRSKFSRPSNYIREVDRTFDEEEYDMEGTDFEWLDDFNKNRFKTRCIEGPGPKLLQKEAHLARHF